jgi:tripartite-type tricarboxylate transporter receptor subunit TctC
MVEAGLKGFVSAQWFGLLAPAKTPADVVARINEIAMKAIAEPSVGQRIIDQGGFPRQNTPAEFAKFIESEVKVWGDIIRTANVTLPD